MKMFFTLFAAFGAGACSPMLSRDLRDALDALGRDRASLCVQVRGGAGAMTISPSPVPVIPGGGGYGSLTICRSNEPGSKIDASDVGGVKIEHGSAAAKEMADRLEAVETALRYLISKLAEAAGKKGAEF